MEHLFEASAGTLAALTAGLNLHTYALTGNNWALLVAIIGIAAAIILFHQIFHPRKEEIAECVKDLSGNEGDLR